MRIVSSIYWAVKEIKQFIEKINFKKLLNTLPLELKVKIKENIYKLKNLAQTNFDLGIYHYMHNNIADAILRFKMAKFFDSKFIVADYFIAKCYHRNFKFEQAIKHINLYLKTNDKQYLEEAKYYLNIINNNTNDISSIPISSIRDIFDLMSKDSLSHKQITENEQQLMTLVLQTLAEESKAYGNVLDLGCGFGIIGKICRAQKIAKNIIGVDVSQVMAKHAQALELNEMKVYNKVVIDDYKNYLNNIEEKKFDLIIASDFITYNPMLDHFFSSISKVANKDTLLAISFRSATLDKEFKILLQRFYFASDYVKQLAQDNNWHVMQATNVSFANMEVGEIIILRYR